MSAVVPLITEIRKIELNCSGVLDLKSSVVGSSTNRPSPQHLPCSPRENE